eukprot:2469624-Prymnesium_polylepis.1
MRSQGSLLQLTQSTAIAVDCLKRARHRSQYGCKRPCASVSYLDVPCPPAAWRMKTKIKVGQIPGVAKL